MIRIMPFPVVRQLESQSAGYWTGHLFLVGTPSGERFPFPQLKSLFAKFRVAPRSSYDERSFWVSVASLTEARRQKPSCVCFAFFLSWTGCSLFHYVQKVQRMFHWHHRAQFLFVMLYPGLVDEHEICHFQDLSILKKMKSQWFFLNLVHVCLEIRSQC